MSEDRPRPELVAFVQRYIRSLEQLEILLLLSTPPLRPWLVIEVYDSVKSNPASVWQRLEELHRDQLLIKVGAKEPEYVFQPQEQRLRDLVAELAVLYEQRRVRVRQIIYPGGETRRDSA